MTICRRVFTRTMLACTSLYKYFDPLCFPRSCTAMGLASESREWSSLPYHICVVHNLCAQRGKGVAGGWAQRNQASCDQLRFNGFGLQRRPMDAIRQ